MIQNHVLFLLKRHHNYIQRLIQKHFLAHYSAQFPGVSFFCLKIIADSNSLCHQKDIEKILDLRSPTVTQILKQMEKYDLITRIPDPNDRRYKIIKATPSGIALNKKITEDMSQLDQEIKNKLSPDQMDGLVNCFETIEQTISNYIKKRKDDECHDQKI